MSQMDKVWKPEKRQETAERAKMLDEMKILLMKIENGNVLFVKYHDDRDIVPFDSIEGIVSYILSLPHVVGDVAQVPDSWEDLCASVEMEIQGAFSTGQLNYPHQKKAGNIIMECLRKRNTL